MLRLDHDLFQSKQIKLCPFKQCQYVSALTLTKCCCYVCHCHLPESETSVSPPVSVIIAITQEHSALAFTPTITASTSFVTLAVLKMFQCCSCSFLSTLSHLNPLPVTMPWDFKVIVYMNCNCSLGCEVSRVSVVGCQNSSL